MIQIERIILGGVEYIRTYSDAGYKIRKEGTGEVYDEAIDPAHSGRTYTETEEKTVHEVDIWKTQ